MYQATKPDYKEFFSIGLELPEDDPSVLAGEALRGPNNWPDFMPSLQPALYGYYEAIGACGADLLRAVAVSLDIDEMFFVQQIHEAHAAHTDGLLPAASAQVGRGSVRRRAAYGLRVHHAAVAGQRGRFAGEGACNR